MKTLDQATFETLLTQVAMKPRLKKDLKFVASTAYLSDDWSDYELIPISDRTGSFGVLLVQLGEELYVAPYELSRRIVDSSTGRDRAIICDFCYTWQPGSNAASIIFTHAETKHSIRLLCCGDLRCSQHVRTITRASKVSRTHLRENLTNEARVARLKSRLLTYADQLGWASIKTL